MEMPVKCRSCSVEGCCRADGKPCSLWMAEYAKKGEVACFVMCRSVDGCRVFKRSEVGFMELLTGTLTPHICAVCGGLIFGDCYRFSDGGVMKYLHRTCRICRSEIA